MTPFAFINESNNNYIFPFAFLVGELAQSTFEGFAAVD